MKKKRWKKLLAWVITCCMLIGMAPEIWAETPETSEALEEATDYQYQYGSIKSRPDEDFGIDKFFNCWIKNSEHPDGENLPVEITDVEIIEGTDVVSLQPTENGWNLRTEQCGTAKVKITYNPVEGSSDNGEHTFDISVDNQVCRMNDPFSDTGTDNLLPGESQTVTVEAWLDCYDEERGHYREENVANVLSLDYSFNAEEYDNRISVKEIESGEKDNGEVIYKMYEITASENAETPTDAAVYFRSYWLDENGDIQKDEEDNDCIAEEREYRLNINTAYYNLEPLDLNDGRPLAVGESIKVTPELIFYQVGENPQKVTENIKYRWEIDDPNIVEVRDSDGNIVEDMADSPSYTITKHSNDHTGIRLIANLPDENGDYNEVARRDWWLDPMDYNLSFKDLREGDWTWIFTDETLEYRLDTDFSEDNYYYTEWKIGRYYEDGTFDDYTQEAFDAGIYSEAEDGSHININGTKIREEGSPFVDMDGFHVEAILKRVSNDGDYEVASVNTWTVIRDCEYNVDYPYDFIKARPKEDFGIDKSFNCHIRNSEHPDGEDIPVEITDVEIIEGVDVVSLQQTENGWNLRTEQCGTAKVKITYNPVEGNSDNGEYTFDISVDDQVCRMDISDEGTDHLVPGESRTVTVKAWLDCYDEERGHYGKDNVKDDISIGHIFYDENARDLISVEEVESGISENGETLYKTYNITAKEDAETDRDTNVTFLCYWLDENGEIQRDEEGNGCTAEEQRYDLHIRESYYNLEPANLDAISIGQSIPVTPRLMFHKRGADPQEITNDLNYRWEYNADEVEIKDSDGNPVDDNFAEPAPSYTITKLTNNEPEIKLVAGYKNENGDPEEIERWWRLNRLEYPLSFEGLRGDNWTYIYTNESSMEIRLDTSSLDGLNEYTVEWMIGEWDENDEFTEQTDEIKNLYHITQDGKGIVIDGTKLHEEGSPFADWGGFDVRALIKIGDDILAEHGIRTDIREPRYEYWYPIISEALLPGSNYWFDKSFDAYIEDAEYPDGYDTKIDITSVTVENADGTEGNDPVVTIEEQDDAWILHMNRYGDAWVKITYDPIKGSDNSGEHIAYINVSDRISRINITSDTGTDCLLPGESQTITVETWWASHDEETGNDVRDNVENVLSLGYLEPSEEFNELFTIEETGTGVKEDGMVLYKTYKITAKETDEDRGTEITFASYWKDENGDIQTDEKGDPCIAELEDYWVNVNHGYYNLEPLSVDNPSVLPGKSIKITPKLTWYEIGKDPQEITEDLNYRWEYDPEVVELKDSNGNIVDSGCVTDASSYTITKRSNSSAEIILIADRPDENGIYNEVTRRYYYLYYTEPEAHTFNVTSLINGEEPDDEKDYISGTQVTLSAKVDLTCECKDTDVTYEWYKVDGETQTKVENETNTLVVTMGDTEEEYICNVIHNENEQSVSFKLKPHVHTIESHEGKEATCGQAGWKAYDTCKHCDYTTYEVIPATGKHSWDQGKVTGGKKVYTCTVCGNIKEEPLPVVKVNKISITGSSQNIAAGKKVQLTATVLPNNAANKKVVWSSSNKKVATVSQSGLVTVLKNTGGKSVTITAAAADGSGKKATFKINSKKGIVTKVSISGKKTLAVGKSMKLKATVKASSGAYKTLKWTSSNANYATVSSKGVVKALKAGKNKTVTITAMALDGSGKKATFKIKIK